MPRWNNHIPKLRHHRATDRAVVTIDGKHIYLGRYGTPEAEAEYRRVIAEHLTLGEVRPPGQASATPGCTIDELVLRYWRHCEQTMTASTREKAIDLPPVFVPVSMLLQGLLPD